MHRTPSTATRTRAVLSGVLLAGLLAAAPARAEGIGDVAADAGIGVATVLGTAIYGPAKMIFATGGFIAGGFTWIFSGGNDEAAMRIFSPTGRGDYVVTRAHLTGREQIAFVGPPHRGGAAGARPDVAADAEKEAW